MRQVNVIILVYSLFKVSYMFFNDMFGYYSSAFIPCCVQSVDCKDVALKIKSSLIFFFFVFVLIQISGSELDFILGLYPRVKMI